jgi:A/G-specific adenine glycosylase
MSPSASTASDDRNTYDIIFGDRATVFRRKLRKWFNRNCRQFDWRETKDPYAILLSEVLLQRTQAPQVSSHFKNILCQFPTPTALSAAPYDEVYEALRPLGLAKRAQTLVAMARVLVENFEGRVPQDRDLLAGLPGVGRYIASATLCFAFGLRIPIVDTNVIRIFSRYFGIISNERRPKDDPQLWKVAEMLLPRKNIEEYNWALIDFAALVCTARKPSCQACPMSRECRSSTKFLPPSK